MFSHCFTVEQPDNLDPSSGRKDKVFNLKTYKFHSLGDVVTCIRMFGTTDSYSTQTVCFWCSYLLWHLPNNQASQSRCTEYPRHTTSVPAKRMLVGSSQESKCGKCAFRGFGSSSTLHQMRVSVRMMNVHHGISLESPKINLSIYLNFYEVKVMIQQQR